MKNVKLILTVITSFFLIITTACDSTNDSGPDFTGEEVTYELSQKGDSGVSGTATFAEIEGGSTLITIDLNGTPSDGNHPSHIHINTAAEGGGIVVSLTNIDGSTGESETTVESTDGGDRITYSQLIEYDGYINVHLSPEDLATVVSQGDIGANAFTGNDVQYTLDSRNSSGVSGTVTFKERNDGTTLGILDLSGTPQDGNHPAHIHQNSASEGGPIVISFNNVDGTSGQSRTQIEEFDDGSAVTYQDITNYDGYVNIHLSPDDLTVVAQGNIGSNGTDTGEGGGSGY